MTARKPGSHPDPLPGLSASGWGANPPGADFIPALTGLRGLAAGWVLLFHTWQFAGSPLLAVDVVGWHLDFTFLASAGYIGVDLFFVLSGFLLAMPFHRAAAHGRARPALGRFWVRRCRRVLPAYWVQLASLVALLFLLKLGALPTWLAPLRSLIDSRPDLLHPLNLVQHVLLVQNISPWQFHYINGVYWTMPIEWNFYVVLPVLAVFLARSRWWLVLTLILVWVLGFRLLCYLAWLDPAAHRVVYPWIIQLPSRVDEFFFGVLGAWIHVHRSAWLSRPCWWLCAGAAGVLGMAFALSMQGDFVARVAMPGLLFQYTLVGAAFAVLVVGAAGQRGTRRIWFAGRIMGFLGVISYSLYLWHYPMLRVAQSFGLLGSGQPWAMLQVLAVTLVPILLVAWLSWRFVERPFLVRKRRIATTS